MLSKSNNRSFLKSRQNSDSHNIREHCRNTKSSFAKIKLMQKQTRKSHKKLRYQKNKNNQLEESGKKIDLNFAIDQLDQTDPLTFTFAPTQRDNTTKRYGIVKKMRIHTTDLTRQKQNGACEFENALNKDYKLKSQSFKSNEYFAELAQALNELSVYDTICAKQPTIMNLCILKGSFLKLLDLKRKKFQQLGVNMESQELEAILQIQNFLNMIDSRLVLSLIFPHLEKRGYSA